MASTLSSFDRRKARVRRSLRRAQGDRPRLSVFRSSKHIYAQIIDDAKGHTLAAASSIDAEFKGKHGRGALTCVFPALSKASSRPRRHRGWTSLQDLII